MLPLVRPRLGREVIRDVIPFQAVIETAPGMPIPATGLGARQGAGKRLAGAMHLPPVKKD